MDGLIKFSIHDKFFERLKRERRGEKGDKVSHKVIGWWKYNPLLQKPTSLDPVKPWGWFWYYGPDPASGCSYGQYHDEENDFDMITAKDSVVYSPATGKPMQFMGTVPEEEFSEKVTKVTGKSFHRCSATCSSCDAQLVSDYDLTEVDKVHCCKCGELCEVSAESADTVDAKTIKGEKTMTREERIKSLKSRIRANISKKKKAEASKERRTRLDEEERKKRKEMLAEKNRLTLKRKVRAEEEKEKKEDDEDELISLDSIMEAMEEENEDEGAEDVSEDAYLDDSEDKEECEEGEVCGAEGEEEESVEPELDDEEPVEMGSEGSDEEFGDEDIDLDLGEETAEEPEESVEESTEEPKDEYYDLDMVLSMINKKEKMLKAKAAKAKTKKKIKGEEELEKDKEKDSEFSLLDEEKEEKEEKEKIEPAEAGEKEKTEETEETEKEEKEEVAPAAKEDLEAMKFEPLASLNALKNVRKEDIDMALYHEDSENPTWNITVAGVPTASVQLKKQSSPDEIRSVFCSEDYAKDLMIHCEKTGFIQTMNKVKADFWSNHTSNKKIAERFKNEAKASFDGERKKLLASFKQEFRSCINIVSAGMSKNFYPELGNSLKEHLFTNIRTVGLPEQTSISVVEKSFAEGAAQYFDGLFEKAEEYMNLSPEARKEIAAAISQGASLEHASGMNESLADRVAEASLIPNMVSGTPLRVTKDVLMDTESYKAELRSVWGGRR